MEKVCRTMSRPALMIQTTKRVAKERVAVINRGAETFRSVRLEEVLRIAESYDSGNQPQGGGEFLGVYLVGMVFPGQKMTQRVSWQKA